VLTIQGKELDSRLRGNDKNRSFVIHGLRGGVATGEGYLSTVSVLTVDGLFPL